MLLRRPFLWFLLLNFLSFLLSEGEIFVLELFGVFLYFGVIYSTICIETCEYYRAASPWELFLFFFPFFTLFSCFTEYLGLFTGSKVRSISFGVLWSICFKGVLDLSIYLRDGSTPTSPAQGPSSRVIWNSLLRICYSQIVEVMTDPNLIVRARAFLHELLGFLASGPWVGLLHFFIFIFLLSFVFCGQFTFLSSAFPFSSSIHKRVSFWSVMAP